MENPIYKMMINNVKIHIKAKAPKDIDYIDAFRISEVLAICWCVDKEKVIQDIIGL